MRRCPKADDGKAQERRETNSFRKRNDPINRLYWLASWKRFCRIVFNRNQICQRIIKGEQCREAATVVHHLISPRQRPDLFLDPTNVLALCEHCHPGGEEGTPLWREGVDYVKSIISAPICV